VDMWTTQARCPHADSGNNNIGNNNRRQSFEIGPKLPTRLHDEAK